MVHSLPSVVSIRDGTSSSTALARSLRAGFGLATAGVILTPCCPYSTIGGLFRGTKRTRAQPYRKSTFDLCDVQSFSREQAVEGELTGFFKLQAQRLRPTK